MKIIALQGSPRSTGCTQMVLDKFLEGASDQGAEYETIQLSKQTIKPCTGCLSCWLKHPGVCKIKDDIQKLIEKCKEVDVIVYATPLYAYTMSSYMKHFIERIGMLLLLPFIEKPNVGLSRHLLRYPEWKEKSIILISVCGFPEIDNFNGLVETFKYIAHVNMQKLVGVLLRPNSETLLMFAEEMAQEVQEVLNAFYRAGEELVKNGQVSTEIEEAVSKSFIRDFQTFIDQANFYWTMRMEYEERKAQGEKMLPLKDFFKSDIRMCLVNMSSNFNREVGSDLQATIQFEISGQQSGNWYFSISNGHCSVKEGKVENPTLTIKTPSEIWIAIINKQLNPQQAFMEQKYVAEGDFSLLVQMEELFL
jgi:multimeric flavodoxin WrbA/putative sterol carrier protein